MNTKDWKQNELNRLLMEKFNLSNPELEEEVEIDESHCGGKRDEEELEEALDDGDTTGSDSVDAGLDDNPEFTQMDLAAEKGGKRGKK